jgi:ABC-2 type transport system ATP-binding protein
MPVAADGLAAMTSLGGVRQMACRHDDGRSTLELVLEDDQAIGVVFGAMERLSLPLLKLTKREPTLEDVFVDLVGRSMAEVERGGPAAG